MSTTMTTTKTMAEAQVPAEGVGRVNWQLVVPHDNRNTALSFFLSFFLSLFFSFFPFLFLSFFENVTKQ